MKYPNLFIVGVPRSGTTSMVNWLSEHPQIYFNLVIEPLYFAEDVVKKKLIKNEKEYLKLFNGAKNAKYVGEKSVHYIYSKNAAKKIKQFNQDAKILIMIRKKEEVIESYNNFRKGFEKQGNIREDIVQNIGEFKKGVDLFKKVFGKNVKVIKFEDLKSKPEKTYNDVLKFLNVGPFKPSFKKYNKVIKKSSKPIVILNQFIPKKVKNMFPQKWRVKFREMLR